MANGELAAMKAAKENAASNAAAEAGKGQSMAMITKAMAQTHQNTIQLDNFAFKASKSKSK